MKTNKAARGVRANLGAGNYSIRYEQHLGARHLVVPVVILAEGVHSGLSGAFLYPAAELASTAHLWNGVPVPVFHPMDGDTAVSCNQPQIMETQVLGRVYNAAWDSVDRKVRAEIWIDLAAAESVPDGPESVRMIQAGEPLEVSSGLFSFDDGEAGTWNGEEYESTITNISPDHLALLPGQRGACSWQDGCGVRANQETGDKSERREADTKKKNQEPKGNQGASMGSDHLNALMEALGETPDKSALIALAEVARENGLLANEPSFQDIQNRLQRHMDALDGGGFVHWVHATFNGHFIWRRVTENGETQLFRQDYTVDADTQEAAPSGEAVRVREDRSFTEINANKEAKNDMNDNEKTPCCPDRVAALIGNEASGFAAEDAEWLNTLTAEGLEKLEKLAMDAHDNKAKDPEPKEEPEPTANKDDEPEPKQPVTAAEYLANAPPEVAETLFEGMRLRDQKRADLTKRVMEHKTNVFSEDELKAMSMEALEKTAKLAGVGSPDYSGQAGTQTPEPKGNEVPKPLKVWDLDK